MVYERRIDCQARGQTFDYGDQPFAVRLTCCDEFKMHR
jgi:hypothetical protein